MNTNPTIPSAGAMRAANAILSRLEPTFGTWLHRDEFVAEIIDRETGARELADFVRECAEDHDDRISPGLKAKARAVLIKFNAGTK